MCIRDRFTARPFSSKKQPDCAATVSGSKRIVWGLLFCSAACEDQKRQFIERVHTKGEAMLIKAKALKGYSLKSLDGDIGSASEFFFDDQYWAIRYLVANTGTWLSGRKVLRCV